MNTTALISQWSMDGANHGDTLRSAVGMNTTALIDQWTMDGAPGDLDTTHFAASDAAAVGTRGNARTNGTAYEVPILVKQPDGEDWRPLGGGDDAETPASDVAERLLGY